MSRVFPTTRQMRVSHHTSTLSRLPFAAHRESPSTSGHCLKRFSVRGYTAAAALHSTEHASDIEANPTWRPVSDRALLNLQSIRSLLARDFGGDVQWVERIDSAAANLQEMKAARIAVYGDGPSGARDVVSALLLDPLADSAASRQALMCRHVDNDGRVLTMSAGGESHQSASHVQVASSWLQQSACVLTEVNSIADPAAIEHELFTSDAIVVVVDPYRMLSSLSKTALEATAGRKKAVVVVNGELPPLTSQEEARQHLEHQLVALSGSAASAVEIIFVDARQAISAFAHLPLGWTTAVEENAHISSIDAFQQNYLQSNFGKLQSHLTLLCAGSAQPQVETARDIGELALTHMSRIIEAEKQINRTIRQSIERLMTVSDKAAQKAKHLSVVSRGIEGGTVEGGVKHSLGETKSHMEQLFRQRWSWLSLILRARADEVGTELKSHLLTQFGSDLQRQLVFESGQLAQLQAALSRETDECLRDLSAHRRPDGQPGPFTSPVLLNHLSTLSLSVLPFDSSSLSGPISLRRRQLLLETVPRLQSSVQKTLVSTLALSGGGVAASWALYVPPLALVSSSTAMGLGFLSVIVSVALGQRFWARAQRKFWGDWHRITSMLKGDLQTLLDEAIQTRLLSKPVAASAGLEKIQLRREHRLGELERALRDLKERI